MSSTGILIEAEDQISKAVYNHKFNYIDTGPNIEALATPFDGMSAVPLTDGATLKHHRHYVYDDLNDIWLDQANPVHTHADDDTGGSYSNIRIGADQTFWGIKETDLLWQTGTGGTYSNTISGSDGYRNISSGGSSGNSGNLVYAGTRYDFSKALYARIVAQMSTVTTSYTTRAGFNMEFAAVSGNAAPKIGIEACNTCNGVNIRVVSADDSVRSASNTTDAASDTSFYKLNFDPDIPRLTYTKNNGTAVIKSSNIPTSGAPNRANAFVVGVKTDTGSARELKLYSLRAFGTAHPESGFW